MSYSDSRTLRLKALAALRGNWQAALLATFAAGLLGMVISALQVRLEAADVYTYGARLGAGGLESLLETASREVGSNWFLSLLGIVNALISPALSLGLIHYYLTLHRGREAQFSLVFSRMNIFFKAFGQSFMMGLFIALWTLLALVPVLFLLYAVQPVNWLVAVILMACAAIPGCIAAFRYAMAPYLMADGPEIPVMESIRRSKEMMNGHKGRLFGLQFSFLGWYFLTAVCIGILNKLMGTLGTALGMLISLAVQVYVQAAIAAFYLELSGDKPREEAQAQGNVA